MLRFPGFLLRDARSFWIFPAPTAEKLKPRKTAICREAKLIVIRINDFSYAANVSYASASYKVIALRWNTSNRVPLLPTTSGQYLS